MDSFHDVFTTFLGLESGSCVAVNAETEISDFIKKIFICVDERMAYGFVMTCG